ncbi:UNVERIFIED_CONTAM: hypothetical protein RMT77_017179 [Armadillidium vulgare]
MKILDLSPAQASFGLQGISALDSPRLQVTCPPPPRCGKKEKFYRTSDGSCNNIYNPRWGQARTAFERIVPPRYADGISSPRRSVTGNELPSPRLVSQSNVPDINRPSREFTLSVMQWGQFLDHDLTHTPIFRFGNSSGIECCHENGQFIARSSLHPECFPISIPANDPFYSRFGRRCMNFVRSLPTTTSNCTLGHREQMNQVTHYLDGSTLYGSSDEDQKELRTGFGGLLRFQDGALLPIDRFIGGEDCFHSGAGLGCFAAGDSRVNEQPLLSIMHTIWFRQHNRLAKELGRLNPHWSDETIFQETRRIVVAQIQHIAYNEWLPIVIGTSTAEAYNLLPLREGFTHNYDRFLSAQIRNEFASIGFRFGHTLVEGMVRLFDKSHNNRESINLFEHFNRPGIIYQRFDELLRVLFKQPMQSFDNNIVDDLTNRLFQTDTMPFGMDLISLNTQRARDHATGTYNDLREACGVRRARTFSELRDLIRPESIEVFRRIYASVDDIDPFVAAISEASVNGGVLGTLFSCIIRDQFTRLKFGDRFYYENGGMETSFTEAQLYEIRKTSWASIICANGDDVERVQPLAFRLPGPNNEKVPCSSAEIPKLDLTAWISAPRETYGYPSS